MKEEIWKPISGFKGYYEISTKGRVKSLSRPVKTKWGGTTTKKELIMKPKRDGQGYERIGLHVDGSLSVLSVHRLVGNHFIPNPSNKKEINHKNGVQWDNRVDNLEWVTPSENQYHALENGLKIPVKGEGVGTSVLKEKDVIEIKKMLKQGGVTQKSIGEMYGVTKFAIQKINVGKNWKWLEL